MVIFPGIPYFIFCFFKNGLNFFFAFSVLISQWRFNRNRPYVHTQYQSQNVKVEFLLRIFVRYELIFGW